MPHQLSKQPSHKPASAHKLVFVLWREFFDESAAVTFVTTLRARGLRVYIVGLEGTAATGQHGLMITADRTLGQVQNWVARSLCVITPCDVASFLHAESDPRLMDFFAAAVKHCARLVLSSEEIMHHAALAKVDGVQTQVMFYATQYDLPYFADELATILLAGRA